MRLVLGLLFALCLASVPALAGPADKPGDLIASEGALVVTDGSSYYRFEKGGKFRSGPLGISGRTIEGKWTSDGAYTFTIEGTWGWVNGVSEADDRRRMVVGVEPPFDVDTKTTSVNPDAKKIRHCYWTVDELVKLPKPPPAAPSRSH